MVIDRIKQIIDYKKISTRKFCIEVGIANGFFDKVKDIGTEKVLKILDTYPDISPEWLLTGKPPMLRNQTVQDESTRPHPSHAEEIQSKERIEETINNERKPMTNDERIDALIRQNDELIKIIHNSIAANHDTVTSNQRHFEMNQTMMKQLLTMLEDSKKNSLAEASAPVVVQMARAKG